MHEQSETVQNDAGKWVNIHGKTRKTLKRKYAFERDEYDSVEEAVEAAKKRSQYEGGQNKPTLLRRSLQEAE